MLYKILKVLAVILSLLGLVFLVRILAKGNDEIKAAALIGDTAIVDPIAIITYVVLGVVILFVLFFVLKNLFTNTTNLKNTLIVVGAFALVLIISYSFSNGSDESFKLGLYEYGDNMASEFESKIVGGGLIAFYILITLATISMLLSGVKKIIGK